MVLISWYENYSIKKPSAKLNPPADERAEKLNSLNQHPSVKSTARTGPKSMSKKSPYF